MKTTFKISICFILTLSLFTFSCGSDDNSEGNSGINALNLVTNFNENPMTGASVGTIQTSSSNSLTFSITSQTPAGALAINSSKGELTVANAALFDYETNPLISAAISVIDANTTATANAVVNLNDLDDIASFLSTSETAYTTAADGDWVTITETEYNTLATSLNEVTEVATSDSEYDVEEGSSDPNFTVASDNGHDIPNASYVFAFKYNA